MKYKGNLVGGQIDLFGDQMSINALKNIAESAVGKPVRVNFDEDTIIGKVDKAEYNPESDMIEVIVKTFDHAKNDLLGKGLSIGGRIKTTIPNNNRYYTHNIIVIDDFELMQISILGQHNHSNWVPAHLDWVPGHLDWVITEVIEDE